ncbi:MAG: DUF2085 domain-containing protein [Anaerolineae bacterium]|jgi:uncharacterized membrane protein
MIARFAARSSWLTAILLVAAVAAFLIATPPGLLRKSDIVGYAVCHQIDSHSFRIGGRYLPLCARCTGTFLGAMVGLLGQRALRGRQRAGDFPPTPILAILAGFMLVWMGDGLNAYLALIGGPHLYPPSNAVRLATGTLNGLALSALVFPVFNISFWRFPADEPAIRSFSELGVLLLLEAAPIAIVLSRKPFLLYPLALLSAAGVVGLLTSVNTVIALLLLRRENSVANWRQALPPICLGMAMSLVQIGLIGLIRFQITGTLDGIPPLS